MDDFIQRALLIPSVKRTVELVGLTATLWNDVELLWYLIYTGLLPGTPRKQIDRIYSHFLTGAAKLEFTLHLATDVMPDTQLEWLKHLAERTKELAGLRNAIIHGDYRLDVLNAPPGLRVSHGGKHNRRPNRLAKAADKLNATIEAATEDISSLIDELDEFRLYCVQNPLSGADPGLPWPAERLEAMPLIARETLPRECREKIALRKFPKKAEKRARRQQ